MDELSAAEIKTKAAVELLKRLGVDGKAVLVDVAVDDKLSQSSATFRACRSCASATR